MFLPSFLPHPSTLSDFKPILYPLDSICIRKFPFYNGYLWKIWGSGGWLRCFYMLPLFSIIYIWIKSQGPGLGHFQFMPKYQKGNISIGMTQATPQIFTLPFTPLTLQWRICEFGDIPESYKSPYFEFKTKPHEGED